MPYYRCSACDLTVYSGVGRSNARVCPECGAELDMASRLFVTPRRRPEVHRHMVREPQAASAARRDLAALRGELDGAEFDLTALLMTELITNSVLHAGAGAGTLFELDVFVTDDIVRVSVTDGGGGFVADAGTPKQPTDGHWGLQLVDELADRWGTSTDRGTTVWFELDRQPAMQRDERVPA